MQSENELQHHVHKLRQLFKNTENNLFLRGSFARGEHPFNDIDISAYNFGGEILSDGLPEKYIGVPIAFGSLPLEHLDQYLHTCLRGYNSLMETIEITSPNPFAGQIVDHHKKLLLTKLPEYALYLKFEELLMRRKWESGFIEDSKNQKGSKRSIHHATLMIKTLAPELFNSTFTEVAFHYAIKRGLLTEDIYNDCKQIPSLIREKGPLLKRDLDYLAKIKKIDQWIEEVLSPFIDEFAKRCLPSDFTTRVTQAYDTSSDPAVLSQILTTAYQEKVSYRKWVLIYFLSSNPSLPQHLLIELWNAFKNNFPYRNVKKNLLHNRSFPVKMLSSPSKDFLGYASVEKPYRQRVAIESSTEHQPTS